MPDGIRQAAGDPTDRAVVRSLVAKIAAEVGSPQGAGQHDRHVSPGEAPPRFVLFTETASSLAGKRGSAIAVLIFGSTVQADLDDIPRG